MADKNAQKKKLAIEYYAEVPVFRYAAMAASVNEDTLANWRKEDSVFSERLYLARAAWVRKNLPKAKVEFALERLEREIFAPPKQEVKHSGIDAVGVLLKEYGITEGDDNDSKDDEPVQSSPQS